MIQTTGSQGESSELRKPLPAGSCDTHAHVFGPYTHFPLAEPRPYTPDPAPKEDYFAMLKAAGFERGVLVHGGAHGWDHSAMLDAIATDPKNLRGIGVLPANADRSMLVKLAEQGVAGLRFTEVAGPSASQRFDGRVGFDALFQLAPLMKELGMQAVIWANLETLVDAAGSLRRLGLPLVIDHLGFFNVEKGVHDPAFQALLSLVSEGIAWVKLTVFRNSKRPPSYEDVRPFHEALVNANPDRLLWGSDWPFLGMKANKPAVSELLNLLDEWLQDDRLRSKILVENPALLYRF